ncbi:MAG: hypothetical protein ACRDRN_28160, partial [Sciscionella sp.]
LLWPLVRRWPLLAGWDGNVLGRRIDGRHVRRRCARCTRRGAPAAPGTPASAATVAALEPVA